MKYSFMSLMCTDYDDGRIISTALKYGYWGVDIRSFKNHAHGIEIEIVCEDKRAITS